MHAHYLSMYAICNVMVTLYTMVDSVSTSGKPEYLPLLKYLLRHLLVLITVAW